MSELFSSSSSLQANNKKHEDNEKAPVAESRDEDANEVKHEEVAPHVRQVRLRLERCLRHLGLTPFSTKFILQHISNVLQQAEADSQPSPLPHVLPYLLQLLQPRPRIHEPLIDRKGCPQVIPDLRAQPFWDTSLFPWVTQLESHIDEIRDEVLQLNKSLLGFQKYRSADQSETTDSGHWHVCYLSLHGMDFSDNANSCPQTMKIIKSIPRFYHHALFSALDKSTHVTAHYGPTNKKLRCFLPLFVPTENDVSCSWVCVNHETRRVEEGKVLIFDDSFYHEAGNDSSIHPRIVLIIDVWHPDLTDAEVRILEFINKGQISAAKRLAKQAQEEQEQAEENGTESPSHSFLTTIELNKQKGISEEDAVRIWGQYLSSKDK
jgi:aspartate beta-hydroxylase